MDNLRDLPLLVFMLSLAALWLSAQCGVYLRQRLRPVEDEERKDLTTIEAATLTLLGLIIAFSFSMAINRYDQRKQCEAEEANAIGTEYVRTGLLPPAVASQIQDLLREYVHERVVFYETRDEKHLQDIDANTARLESELWSRVVAVAGTQPSSPTVALAVSGMNDVLNDRGYTQAAWWNRIPIGAWSLMISIAILCNAILGYSAHRTSMYLFFVLPLALSISFFLIADVDSPRGGIIRVIPKNLVKLSVSLQVR